MRIVVRIIVMALLGLILTVGVAWGVAVYANPLDPVRVLDGGSESGDMHKRWAGTARTGAQAWWSATQPDEMPDWFAPPAWTGIDEPRERPFRMSVAMGWPLAALASDYGYLFSAGYTPDPGIRVAGDWEWLDGQFVQTSLPVRPLWGGLLVNIVLYTAVAYALICAPGDIRRARRGRDGVKD